MIMNRIIKTPIFIEGNHASIYRIPAHKEQGMRVLKFLYLMTLNKKNFFSHTHIDNLEIIKFINEYKNESKWKMFFRCGLTLSVFGLRKFSRWVFEEHDKLATVYVALLIISDTLFLITPLTPSITKSVDNMFMYYTFGFLIFNLTLISLLGLLSIFFVFSIIGGRKLYETVCGLTRKFEEWV